MAEEQGQLKLYYGFQGATLPLQLTPGAVYVIDSGTSENAVFKFGDMYIDLDNSTRLHIGGGESKGDLKRSDYVPGIAAALTTNEVAIPNLIDVGTLPTLTTTSFKIPNISVDDVSVVSDLELEQGENPCSLIATENNNQVESTDYRLSFSNQQPIINVVKTKTSIGSASEGTNFEIEGVDTWSEGTTPSFGADITVTEVDN